MRVLELYNVVEDAVLVVDLNHIVVYCNETGAKLAGLTKEQIAGKMGLMEIFQCDDNSGFHKASKLEDFACTPYREVGFTAPRTGLSGSVRLSYQKLSFDGHIFFALVIRGMDVEGVVEAIEEVQPQGEQTQTEWNTSEQAFMDQLGGITKLTKRKAPSDLRQSQGGQVHETDAGVAAVDTGAISDLLPMGTAAKVDNQVSLIVGGKKRIKGKGVMIGENFIDIAPSEPYQKAGEAVSLEVLKNAKFSGFECTGTITEAGQGGYLLRIEFASLRPLAKKSISGYLEKNAI